MNFFDKARQAHKEAEAERLRRDEIAQKQKLVRSGALLLTQLAEKLGMPLNIEDLTLVAEQNRYVYIPDDEPIVFWVSEDDWELRLIASVNYPAELYGAGGEFRGVRRIDSTEIDDLEDLGKFLSLIDSVGDKLFALRKTSSLIPTRPI